MTQSVPDIDLLRAASAGDRSAFERLYRRHSQALFGYAMVLTGDGMEAQDLLHDAFLELLKKPETYSGKGSFKGLLMTVLRHKFLKTKRRVALDEKHNRTLRATAQYWQFDEAQSTGWNEEQIRQLNFGLLKLPVDQRECIVLKIHEQLTFEQIAKLTATPVKTVESRYYLGLNKLKEALHRGA